MSTTNKKIAKILFEGDVLNNTIRNNIIINNNYNSDVDLDEILQKIEDDKTISYEINRLFKNIIKNENLSLYKRNKVANLWQEWIQVLDEY